MSNQLTTLASKLAQRVDPGNDGSNLIETLKATAFKGQVSDAQMTALLIVANQYGLNPWTKEIYAFPDKNNGIVPVVGVDGWSRIINEHKQFDGLEFKQDDDSCTCIIYRKDRAHPVSVTEYMSECKRDIGPWKSHPKRMLRHKALIQAARLAFGYVGIYDQDEAERIIERDMGNVSTTTDQTPPQAKEKPAYPEADLQDKLPLWARYVAANKTDAKDLIASISTKYTLTDAQKAQIMALDAKKPIEGEYRKETEGETA